jgi:hypothetical protein
MPQNSTYGAWPASGEIDVGVGIPVPPSPHSKRSMLRPFQIAEARGNAASYLGGGIDKLQGGIHWGPLPQFDSWWRTFGIQQDRIRGYHADFHKYTLEWDERYLTICKSPLIALERCW